MHIIYSSAVIRWPSLNRRNCFGAVKRTDTIDRLDINPNIAFLFHNNSTNIQLSTADHVS